MKALNKTLDRLIKEKNLSNEDVARDLGIYTAASIGNYRRGKRDVPTDLVIKWKELYGEDLFSLSETNVSKSETNVPRETKTNVDLEKLKVRDPWDTVDKLTDAFVLNSEIHRDEVEELRKDKTELWEMIRFLRGTNSPAHKAK